MERAMNGLLASVLVTSLTLAGIAQAEPETARLSLTPELGWAHGDHVIDVDAHFRYRWEYWKAESNKGTDIHGIRGRIGAGYTWRDRFRVYAQAQVVSLLGMEPGATGAAGLYRASAGKSSEWSIDARQLYAELRWDPILFARVGRQDINQGTLIKYAEPHWNYLRQKRMSQRLLGTVDWTNVARSYDAVSALVEPMDGNKLHVFVAQPTTGVFEIAKPYKANTDIITGGFDWTVERDRLLENVEFTGFFTTYHDSRDPMQVAGLFGDIELYTFGASALGVHPCGPGRFDWLLWGAFQVGNYVDSPDGTQPNARELDQVAGAIVAEAGYQWPEVWGKPWLRAGVSYASGDTDTGDGNRNTFFNILPTNHLYYGYADQLAFQNLVDLLVQLKLSPLPKLGIELVFHQFLLPTAADRRWFGTGAFNKTSLGYGSSPSNGSNNVGQELDIVVAYKVHRTLTLAAGFAKLFGGRVFESFPDRDTDFAFVQVQLNY
jgi:hypothetical protein